MPSPDKELRSSKERVSDVYDGATSPLVREIERLRNDIQELTCGDPRKVCPNCRDKQHPETTEQLVGRSVFDAELKALGERLAADGKIVIKQLLHEVEVNSRAKCRFDNWPPHLKADAYKLLGLEPVEMFRRLPVNGLERRE